MPCSMSAFPRRGGGISACLSPKIGFPYYAKRNLGRACNENKREGIRLMVMA